MYEVEWDRGSYTDCKMSKPIKREHLNWDLVKGGGGVILGWGGGVILRWESALEWGYLKNIREVLGRGGYSEQSTSRWHMLV